MSYSCALHTTSTSLTMEKSVQCDNVPVIDVEMIDTEKENQDIQVNVTDDVTESVSMTNGCTPSSMTSKELQPQPQPLVKAISEEKYPFIQNILRKRVKDDMNMEILDFHSNKEGCANFSLNPLLPKAASLVTVIKFQGGEFVEVKSTSSYNSSMCLRDMKSAITAALDSCITQLNPERPVVPSPPRSRSANTASNNSPQPTNESPKRSPPKRVPEDTTGTSENITSTSDGTLGSPKDRGLKGTRPKGTTDGPKGVAEKPKKKTSEKVKNKSEEVSKEMPQTSKAREEVPTPKPPKPEQVRVKKPKIPDEESIKFANRQREIMKMKKELKERLKREGKEGVDPASRINAWGRTVGVTCTMCGNHVQKSYGCFRRDTAPERLVHLFTPGMNRIKICRRCLPYKKHAGKLGDFQSKMFTKPGLKTLGTNPQGCTNPQGLNPQPISPISIAPLLADKPVSTTTLNAIHRKVTAGQENTGLENVAHVNIGASHVSNGSGHVRNSPSLVNTSFSFANIGPGHMNINSCQVKSGPVPVSTTSGHLHIHPRHVSAQVNTVSGHTNNQYSNVIDSTAPSLQPEIDLGNSSKGSAIEYIRKLALNLKANYNDQQGESSVAGKQGIVTPEEQIITTPILEHLSSFTPVTPSMSLGNQVTNPPNFNVPVNTVTAAQWKPLLNQITPVMNQVTPVLNQVTPVTPTTEDKPSFDQGTESSMIPTPPWTTVPIVLKTQPSTNIVLTTPNQVPSDMQTFVTTANQKDLKLVPAIMMPSQNTFGGQGPVFLQIQRVNLMSENTGERWNIQDKSTEFQGKHNEIQEQSGLGATDFQNTQNNMFMKDMGGYVGTVEGSIDSRQSLPEEISFAEVENAISALQSLAEDVPVRDTNGDTRSEDVNIMNTMGHLSTDRVNIPVQGHKPSEDINVAGSSKILENRHLNPSETIEGQLLSSGSLGMSYSQQEPTVVICESADVSTQGTTMYPGGYQVIGEKGNCQEGVLGAPGNTISHGCVKNMFQSQISEEYLPQDVLNEKREDGEKFNQANKLETIQENNDDRLLPEGEASEDLKELQDVEDPDIESSLPEVRLSENTEGDVESGENVVEDIGNEAMDEDITVETKEKEGEKVEESKEDVQNEEGSHEGGEDISQEEMEGGGSCVTGLHITSKPIEEPAKKQWKETENVQEDRSGLNIPTKPAENPVEREMRETKSKETTVPEMKSVCITLVDEDVPLDRRRSQRRTASPRKLSPSKSPAKPERKIEPKVHGTRQAAQRHVGAGQLETQKDKRDQLGTQKDKAGQLGTQKDKTGQLGTQNLNDKTGQVGTQKGKTVQLETQKEKVEKQGSQKNENEHDATQGVKRKRGRPSKASKNEEDVGSSDNTKNNKPELVKENRNSPSKRMKTRKD